MADYNWTGGDGTTNFSDPLNWDPTSGPPASGDNATISDSDTLPPPASNAVQITQGTEVNNLTIDDGALNDTGFLVTVDNFLVVGNNSTSDGTPNSLLSIGGGGEIDAAFVGIGQGTGNGGSLTVDDSTLNVTNSLVIGDQSLGQLFLFDGATVTAGTFISVGLNSGGLLSINGAGSTVTLNTTTSGMDVGVDPGSSGDVELSNNGTLTISSFLEVGGDGTGTLGIASGSVVNVGPLTGPIPAGTGDDFGLGFGGTLLGNGNDGTSGVGQAYVDGAGSQLNVSRQIYVGGQTANGGNLLQITNGAVVNADLSGDSQAVNIDGLAIAFELQTSQVLTPTGNGNTPSGELSSLAEDQVIVDGSGSELNVNGTIVVGVNGTGELDISNGASVTGSDNFELLGVASAADGTLGFGPDIGLSGGGSPFDVGSSGLGQFAGSTGTINVVDGSSFNIIQGNVGNTIEGTSLTQDNIDFSGNLDVGTFGTGTLYVAGNSSVTLGYDLAIAQQSGSTGTVQIGDSSLSQPDTSSLTVENVNVGGDFNSPGGNGLFIVESNAEVSIADYLGIWGSATNIGVYDAYNLAFGTVAIGAFPVGESAADFELCTVINPGGQLDLENGVIQGALLNFNGGLFTVTPANDQIDDQHSVLRDTSIIGFGSGGDLSINDAVLTIEGSMNNFVLQPSGPSPDNVLLDATGSLVDLVGLGTSFGENPSFGSITSVSTLTEIINATDIALTVGDPNEGALTDPTDGSASLVISGPSGAIIGTGAIFSDYSVPISGGYFSGDVALENSGLIDAVYNDAGLDNSAQLSILTNSITNESDGIFRADGGATLNIGSAGNTPTPLDANHVFMNLVDNGDGTTSLVDGAYEAFSGNIDVNGFDASGSALGPISTLEAVLYLGTGLVGSATGNSGDLSVNGTDIEQSLTTITPSATSGEGDLILLNVNTNYFQNTIEIQGLSSTEESATPGWTLEDGTTGQGGGLYLQNATFNGAGLTVDAADPGGAPGFINSNENNIINAPVTMNGYVSSFQGGLEFSEGVTGTDGQYYINAMGWTFSGSSIDFNQGLTGTGNTVTFTSGSTENALYIGIADLADDFQATIQDFAASDVIDLQIIHAVATEYIAGPGTTGELELFNAQDNLVGTLQLEDTVFGNDTTDQFAVTADGSGGTTIRLADPANPAPVITSTDDLHSSVTEVSPIPDTVPAVQSVSDTLSFTDSPPGTVVADGSDGIAYSVQVESDPAALGSLTASVVPPATGETDGTLDLNYTVSDSAIDFLSAGETKTDTFYVELSDNLNTTTVPYTVTINGTNQAPVIGNIDLPTTGFALDGDATVSTALLHPDNTTGGNLYNLLPTIDSEPGGPVGAQGQVGAIWAPVSLSQNFTINAELFFGTGLPNPFNGGSSDGITFTLQDQGADAVGSPNASGFYDTSGEFLGIGGTPVGGGPFVTGIKDAMGVKFDTFNNGSPEPAGDLSFAQFFANGDEETPPSANTDQFNTGNLDNGSWHDVVVSWNAATDLLTYTLDGTITDSITEDPSVFGSSPVFAGFTGASGSAYSPEQVEIVSFTNGTQDPSAFTGGVTDVAGLTTAGVAADTTPLTASGVIDFSDVNQDDTHTASLASASVVANPFYSGPVLGTFSVPDSPESVTQDTTGTGNGGTQAWSFSVADSAVAFLNAGQQFTENFVVDIADNHGGVTPQTIAVTITGSNNDATITATTPNSDQGSVTEFTKLTTSGSLSITDPDSGQSVFQSNAANDQFVVTDQYGTFTLGAATGAWSFALNDSASGTEALAPGQQITDPFTVTSLDGTATHTVDVTITGNGVPTANPDTYTTHFDTPLTVDVADGVLTNDTSPDGDPIQAELLSDPSDGSLIFNPNGSFTYTPTAGVVGHDSFTYEAVDTLDNQLVSAPATVTIDLTDQAPVVVNPEDYTVLHGQTFVGTAGVGGTGLLAGDSDPDGDTLTVTLLSDPSHGTLPFGINQNGAFTYTADNSFVGTDSFTYAVTDGGITKDVTADINVTDQAPVVVNPEDYTVLHGQTFVGTAGTSGTGLLAGDSDPDGDTLTVTLLSDPSHGTLPFGINQNGAFTYTADNSFVGTDSFTYDVTDGAISKEVTADINVTDQAPVVVNPENFTVLHGQTFVGTAGTGGTGLLAGDSDPDGDTLTVTLLSDPSHGTLPFGINPNGAFTYTADNSFVGTDSFTYDVTDGAIAEQVTADINVTDQAPVVVNPEIYTVAPGQSITLTAGTAGTGLLAGDSDPDGDALTVTLLSDPLHGTLPFGINPNGSFTYTADSNYTGPDSFTYDVTDGAIAEQVTADFNIGNSGPQISASAVAVSGTEGSALATTTQLATFTDADPTQTATGDFTATINWGDGTAATQGTIVALIGGGFAVEGGHTYAEEGQFTASVSIQDDDSNTANALSTAAIADAPLTAATGDAISGVEGNAITNAQLATFTDGNPNAPVGDFTTTIAWGDGTTSAGTVVSLGNGNFAVDGSHTYAEEGTFTTSVGIVDVGGSTATASGSTAAIADAPLTAATGDAISGVEGNAITNAQLATFTDGNPNAPVGDFTTTIAWGDGTTSAGTVVSLGNGNFAVDGSHTYAEEGTFTTSVGIVDVGGSTATASGSTAAIADAPLTAATGDAISGVEGNAITNAQLATFTDGNPNAPVGDFTTTIAWGDGTTSAGTVVSLGNGNFAVDGSHTYAEEGTFTTSVGIVDVGGSTATASGSTAAIADAPLTAATGDAISGVEGNAITNAQLATFTDGNPNAPVGDFTTTIAWGDGTTSAGTVVSLGNGNFAVDGSHTYAEEGTFTTSVGIVDVGGSTATASGSTAAIADAPLTAATGDAISGVEGNAITNAQLATFTDGNPNAPVGDFTTTIAWGDGTTSAGTVVSLGNGNFAVDGSHTYAEEGTFTTSVGIVDVGGSTATASGSTAAIADAPLTAATGDAISGVEGNAITNAQLATFTDGNPNAPVGDFTTTIAWGDGTTSAGTVVSLGNGNFAVDGSHTYAEEGTFTTSVGIVDVGGSTATASGSTAAIADAPLTAATGDAISGVEGNAITNAQLATFTDGNPNAPVGDFTTTIAWGDGTTSAGTVVSLGPAGSGEFAIDGSHTYAADGTFTTEVSIFDVGGSTANASSSTASIADVAPLAVNDSYTTTLDQTLTVNAPGVLANDTDIDHDPLSAILQSGPSEGNLTTPLESDGAFVYKPFLAFVGSDSFTYQASDGVLNSNTATVNITVGDGPNTLDFSHDPNQSLNWTVNLSSATETAFNSKMGTETFTGDNNVVAGNGNNTIIGNSNSDVLIGGSGNDTITAGNGANTVVAGGNGTNTMIGGTGNDTFVFTPGSFTDTISSFNTSHDVLDFQNIPGLTEANLVSTILNDVTSAHTASTTTITLDATEHINLVGVTYNQLAATHPFVIDV